MKYKPTIVTAFFRSNMLPAPVYEHRFHPERKWRFDLAWPQYLVAVECDGGIWVRGGHNRGAQMLKDWEKRNTATVMGWRVLYCQPKDLCTEELAGMVAKAITLALDTAKGKIGPSRTEWWQNEIGSRIDS